MEHCSCLKKKGSNWLVLQPEAMENTEDLILYLQFSIAAGYCCCHFPAMYLPLCPYIVSFFF